MLNRFYGVSKLAATDPEIGTENQNRPESEVTVGGNTSINVPGVNIGTDVI
jgi:hypothetical protein